MGLPEAKRIQYVFLFTRQLDTCIGCTYLVDARKAGVRGESAVSWVHVGIRLSHDAVFYGACYIRGEMQKTVTFVGTQKGID